MFKKVSSGVECSKVLDTLDPDFVRKLPEHAQYKRAHNIASEMMNIAIQVIRCWGLSVQKGVEVVSSVQRLLLSLYRLLIFSPSTLCTFRAF